MSDVNIKCMALRVSAYYKGAECNAYAMHEIDGKLYCPNHYAQLAEDRIVELETEKAGMIIDIVILANSVVRAERTLQNDLFATRAKNAITELNMAMPEAMNWTPDQD